MSLTEIVSSASIGALIGINSGIDEYGAFTGAVIGALAEYRFLSRLRERILPTDDRYPNFITTPK